MHTIKPLDVDIILKMAKNTRMMITLEEHSIIGGLGSAVSEVFADHNVQTQLLRFGVPDRFTKKNGSRAMLQEENGLSKDQIVSDIERRMRMPRRS